MARQAGVWLIAIGVALLPGCGEDPLRPTETPTSHLARRPAPNPIVAENALPGSGDWRSGRNALADELALYADRDVVEAGDRLALRIHASTPTSIDVHVYRLGYYGGRGARKIHTVTQVDVAPQPPCPPDPETGLIECRWTDSLVLPVAPDWTTGLYLAKVVRSDGMFRFAPFVVRDRRAAEVLFTTALQTAQAYNRWGGNSLYSDDSGTLPGRKAVVVSHDRPFYDGDGAGQLLRWELPALRFLEARGYDVTYGSGGDFDRYDDVLRGIGLLFMAGHDEYWTSQERTQVDAALASGSLSVAHLGANGAYWRVRLEPAWDGRHGRRIVCFKDRAEDDPIPGSTVRFRDGPDARPEHQLLGNGYVSYAVGGFGLRIAREDNWLLDGTGLRAGDILPGLLGYEFDATVRGWTPESAETVLGGAILTTTGMPAAAEGVVRTTAAGRVVFSAGSIYFPLALSADPAQHDDRVERLVENVLERGLEHRRSPRTLAPAGSARPASALPQGTPAALVEPLAGRAEDAGFVDGEDEDARFAGPTALVTLADDSVVVADTGAHALRRITVDGRVQTIAGDGQPGERDGDGAQARFRQPTGLARLADGSLLVADQLNHCVRRVQKAPGGHWIVSTWAGVCGSAGPDDGAAARARFNRPSALAVDIDMNVYIADQGNHRIRKVSAGDRLVTTIVGGGPGDVAGVAGAKARLMEPSALAVTRDNLFVFDAGNGRLRQIALTAPHAVTNLAGGTAGERGYADGRGREARFRAQLGLTAMADGSLLLADAGNGRVRRIVPGRDEETTAVTTIAGSGRAGLALGSGWESDLALPTGVTVLSVGRVAVSDGGHRVVRMMRMTR